MREEAIIDKIQAGDPAGLEALMERYFPYVSAVVWNILRNAMSIEDGEEVVSDVFLAAWGRPEVLRLGQVKAWLGAVARNKAKNRLRQISRTLPLEDDALDIPGSDDPPGDLERAEEQRLVRRAVEALPDLDWERDGVCYQLFGPEAGDRLELEPAEGVYPKDSFGYDLLFRALPDSEPDDNVKDFVLKFTNLSEEGIALNDGVSKRLFIHGLWTQDENKSYEPIFTGDFSFDIGLNFQCQLAALEAEGLTWHDELLGYTNTIRSLSLSPLSLSYCVDCTLPVNDSVGPVFGDVRVVLKDGSEFYSEAQDYDVMREYLRNRPVELPLTREPIREFENYAVFEEPLDLSQVDYVQYGDNRIPVHVG